MHSLQHMACLPYMCTMQVTVVAIKAALWRDDHIGDDGKHKRHSVHATHSLTQQLTASLSQRLTDIDEGVCFDSVMCTVTAGCCRAAP